MLNGTDKQSLSKRWRLRLKAGALVLIFAFLSLLPWVHVMIPGLHGGHGGCHHAASESPTGDAPALVADLAGAADTCWVCTSLPSLLSHADAQPSFLKPAVRPDTLFCFAAPLARITVCRILSNRSQAPPATERV